MNPAKDLDNRLSKAVSLYWLTRKRQSKKQTTSGRSDQGARSAVTGGAHMDGFVDLIRQLLIDAGADESTIFRNKKLELPGFFRPTKEWDLLLVKDNQLVAAIEV